MQEEAAKTTSAFWKTVRSSVRSQRQAMAIQPGPQNGKRPLSFGQERLWRVEQLQPGNLVHNLRAVYRLRGPLDISALRKSLEEIVQRHEILRTLFPSVDGQPVQVITKESDLKLRVEDLGGLPAEQQEAEVRRLASEEAQKPFNLAEGPLLRVKLLRLSPDEHVFLKTIHHIINDRWSDSVFMRELAVAYRAFLSGNPLQLPRLPIQYADFAHFQRQQIQGDVLKSKLDYWKHRLNGGLPILQLPTDDVPPAIPNYRGGSQYLLLPEHLSSGLNKLTHREGVSLFVVLMTAFNMLLSRYSGQQDIVICSPVAGRNRMESKKLIGYFNNMVLIRIRLADNPSFQDVLAQVARVTSSAFEHQEPALQHIADALHIPGAILSRTMFALQNVPNQPLKMADIRITPLDMEEGISNFDLSLSMKRTEQGLKGVMRYKTDLFRPETIKQTLENFQALLEKVVANPSLRLSELPWFGEGSAVSRTAEKPEKAAYTSPRNETEQSIANVWQEVLDLEQTDINTSFFDMGGRSIAMIQVQAKLKKLLKREISATALFTHPTISKIARYLDNTSDREQMNIRPIRKRTEMQKAAISRTQKQMMKYRRKSDGRSKNRI